MTDFYPVLARAVSKLASDSPQARQELYAHARTILVTQLRGRDPQIPAIEIMREQVALETTIRRVESESRSNRTQHPKALTSRLTGSPLTAAEDGIHTINNRELDEVFQEPQPNLTRGRSRQTFASRTESRSAVSLTIDGEVVQESYGSKRPPIGRDGLGWVRDTAQQLPLAVVIDGDNEDSLPGRNTRAARGVADKLKNGAKIRHERLISNEARTAPASKKIKEIGTGRKSSVGIIPISIAVIVVMLAFIALISVTVIVVYMPRMIWLSQHLIDHPTPLLVVIPIILGLFVLLFAPFFRKGRRKSAFRFL